MNAEMVPYEMFASWYGDQLKLNRSVVPSACCLSTNGLDGFPNARFVSLKNFSSDGFIITGPVDSRKGMELMESDKTALTFWWTETQRQVRIQGIAGKIPDDLANQYFSERDRASQLVSIMSQQGKEDTKPENLHKDFEVAFNDDTVSAFEKPANWGGYLIKPIRIEFMQFRLNRFHERWLFMKEDEDWIKKQLQP